MNDMVIYYFVSPSVYRKCGNHVNSHLCAINPIGPILTVLGPSLALLCSLITLRYLWTLALKVRDQYTLAHGPLTVRD